ncbi:MAG: RagB/SusD family nutrient uptake outer membrane protein, partial [Prevotella sp.]|nr:RagB/SusD family nutrient uptake outer membrane protein [Prevotella sp.]
TLSEVYLIAAEAYMKAGNNPKALERINSVRERAGLIDASSIDIESILKERACELFGNGQRYFDLRRTGTLVNHCNLYNPQLENQAQARIGEKILRPIPQAAIDANDQLTSADQNPGY